MDHFKVSNRIIKIVLSVSILSILFSSLPLLFQSLKPLFTQYFNFTVNKTYVFLLCNGLMVCIVKNSGLTNAPSSTTSTEPSPEICTSEFKELDIAAPISEENGVEAEFPEEEVEEKRVIMVDSQKEDEVADTEKEDEDEDEVADTEKDEEEVNNALLIIDAEELNKKCEDFIRKMRAAFCSEPRAHYDHYNYSYSDVDHQKALVAVM